jgi:hypothetical protein
VARDPERDEAVRRVYAAKAEGDTGYLLSALLDPKVRAIAARFVGELKA